MTNSVSFALVAGSICMVKFSYDIGKNGSGSATVTLNISSTGAKTLRRGSFSNNSSMTHGKDLGSSYPTFSATTTAQVIYDGSAYLNAAPTGQWIYGNYSDVG